MLIKLSDISSFVAGDQTDIQEILHPDGDLTGLTYSLALATLPVGKSSLPHRLHISSETYFILQGTGKMYLEDESFHVESGDTIFIPANALQWISNTGPEPLKFLCIVSPPWNEKNEVIEKSR